jgi:hypothetical protein
VEISSSGHRDLSVIAVGRFANQIHVRDRSSGADVVAGEFSRRWFTTLCWGDGDREIWVANGDTGYQLMREAESGQWSTPLSATPWARPDCLSADVALSGGV